MKKAKLQKKWINWFLEQHDITHRDFVEQCRTGYLEQKTWEKPRHWKKHAKKHGLYALSADYDRLAEELCG